MLDKITFENGTIVTKNYLNEVQKGTEFSASTVRDDFYSATDSDHASWPIGQRDKLKDYEISNPREESETAMGRLAHDGIILGYEGDSIESINQATFSEPKTIEITIGGDGTAVIGQGTPQNYGVIVEAGSVLLTTGEKFSWNRQIKGLINATGKAYLYILESGPNITEPTLSISTALPKASSTPFIALAEINTENGAFTLTEEGNVMGSGVIDLRPNLYIGGLNTYSTGVLKNTAPKTENHVALSGERVIADTRNGSIIITLPGTDEDPENSNAPVASDNDRIAIVDLEGSFDRYPVVIRPGYNGKINNSTDDWIINIRDAHVELFYYNDTGEWRFEETPGSECNPTLGTFLSCGGKEFIGTRTSAECPDGQAVPAAYPNPSEGVYRYEASTQKCYKEINATTAIYSNGEGGLIKIFGSDRCKKGVLSGGSAEITKNIIYVDPAIGDDSLVNKGTNDLRPFRTIERALLEAARASRRVEGLDAYDTTVIELAPGDYYVDNSPGINAIGAAVGGDRFIRQVETGFVALNPWTPERPYITIDSNDNNSNQPPLALNLGRTLYTRSGSQGTIYKIEKDSLGSAIWKVYLQFVDGAFNVEDALLINRLSDFNPTTGGIIVPRGISINGTDLRKTRIRPMYVPALTPGQNNAQTTRTYIFKVTGGTYISLLTFTDNQQFSRTHNTVTSIGFASEGEIKGDSAETSYYTKIFSLFAGVDGWDTQRGITPVTAETTIVAPVPDSKDQRSRDVEENQTGILLPDGRENAIPQFPGPAQLIAGDAGSFNAFNLPDVNSTRSSSPYVFNCSVRSIFGLNGMWVDGSRVSGFRSMVTANYTQVSLQTDPNCFESPNTEYYSDPPRNKDSGSGKKYRSSNADPFKYRHWGFRGSADSNIQLVSCFVIGNADHFISETGSDLSITNSCSDFGDISLRARGYKEKSFSQDSGAPKGTYTGSRITAIVPPVPLRYLNPDGTSPFEDGRPATLEDIYVTTGVNINIKLTQEYAAEISDSISAPTRLRLYVDSSNKANPFTIDNPPEAADIGFGQYTWTRKVGDSAYVMSGGTARENRSRVYLTGFDERGIAVLYQGKVVIPTGDKPGFDKLDDQSKVFIWDETAQLRNTDGDIVRTGFWYIDIDTSEIEEENNIDGDGDGYITKKLGQAFYWYIKRALTDNDEELEPIDITRAKTEYIFNGSPVKVIKPADRRTQKERVYKIVLEGFNRDSGMRRPQSYYVFEKQKDVAGYPLNGGGTLSDDPLTVTQVIPYNDFFKINPQTVEGINNTSVGKFVTYLTKSSDARSVFDGSFVPTIDQDQPELTEDPENSVTKVALAEMLSRPAVEGSAILAPSVRDITLATELPGIGGFLVETRRPSVIRASGHTWEWTGYLNYDTSFPTFQGDPLEQDFALGKIIVEETGGRVYATGMNEEGNYYLGTTVFDLRSGEQFSIPLRADNEIGNVTNQVLNNVIINNSLIMGEGSTMFFQDDTKIVFNSTTQFQVDDGGDITAENRPEVYSKRGRAGLIELASSADIRGAYGTLALETANGTVSISTVLEAKEESRINNVAISALQLAAELKARDNASVVAGTGVEVGFGEPIPLPGDDTPDDTSDDLIPIKVSIGQDISGPIYEGGRYKRKDGRSFTTLRAGAEFASMVGDQPVTFRAVYAADDIVAFDTSGLSDSRLKENIISLDGSSLEKIEKLQGVSFNFISKPDVPRIGFIAQDVKEVIPEVVKLDPLLDRYTISHNDLIPLLVESIKELSAKVNDLEKKLNG